MTMLGRIDADLYDPEKCIADQRKFVEAVQTIYFDTIPRIERELAELKLELSAVDTKHSKAIKRLDDKITLGFSSQSTQTQKLIDSLSVIQPYIIRAKWIQDNKIMLGINVILVLMLVFKSSSQEILGLAKFLVN